MVAKIRERKEMLLVLSQEHKEHLGFLASVDVAGLYINLALNFAFILYIFGISCTRVLSNFNGIYQKGCKCKNVHSCSS